MTVHEENIHIGKSSREISKSSRERGVQECSSVHRCKGATEYVGKGRNHMSQFESAARAKQIMVTLHQQQSNMTHLLIASCIPFTPNCVRRTMVYTNQLECRIPLYSCCLRATLRVLFICVYVYVFFAWLFIVTDCVPCICV